VERPPGSVEHDAVLLALAEKLRELAITAGRPEVAVKAGEAVALINRGGGTTGSAGAEQGEKDGARQGEKDGARQGEKDDARQREKDDASDAVIRFLNGLGF
jgi:hypothetical protein